MSHFYGVEFDIWAGFESNLGRLAVLKTAQIKLKYATFKTTFSMFLWAKILNGLKTNIQLWIALIEISHRRTYI